MFRAKVKAITDVTCWNSCKLVNKRELKKFASSGELANTVHILNSHTLFSENMNRKYIFFAREM